MAISDIQGIYHNHFSRVDRTLSPIFSGGTESATYAMMENQKVKDEFLALFYKELLKQAFKPPQPGLGQETNRSSLLGTFSSDLMLEKLALELAQSKSFRAEQLFPND